VTAYEAAAWAAVKALADALYYVEQEPSTLGAPAPPPPGEPAGAGAAPGPAGAGAAATRGDALAAGVGAAFRGLVAAAAAVPRALAAGDPPGGPGEYDARVRAALGARAAAAPRLRAAVAAREARLEVVRGALRAGTLGLAARDAGEGGEGER